MANDVQCLPLFDAVWVQMNERGAIRAREYRLVDVTLICQASSSTYSRQDRSYLIILASRLRFTASSCALDRPIPAFTQYIKSSPVPHGQRHILSEQTSSTERIKIY